VKTHIEVGEKLKSLFFRYFIEFIFLHCAEPCLHPVLIKADFMQEKF